MPDTDHHHLPYIGDLDDPNLSEYYKKNRYLKTGYRVRFNTFRACAESLFMVHNETLNVWSHLIGTIFFVAMLFYVTIYLSPTSMHQQTNLVDKWTKDFDTGRFDHLYCDRDDFEFPNLDNQCPYPVSELLDDMLETEHLLAWHSQNKQSERPSLGHNNLNYHAAVFEKVDHYLRNVVTVLSHPTLYFHRCVSCAKDAISALPGYLDQTLESFYKEIDDCKPMNYTGTDPGTAEETMMDKDSLDAHCKTSKIAQLDKFVTSVKQRT